MKIRCKDFLNDNNMIEEKIFELQEMDALDFYDIQTAFRMGQLKFSEYAQGIIKECVASPAEARKIEFFHKNPKLLDKLIFQVANMSKVGFMKEPEIEIIEE